MLVQTYKRRISHQKGIELPQASVTIVADEAIIEVDDDRLEKAATTATTLEAEQDSGNNNKTQSNATSNGSSSYGTDSGDGIHRRQETNGSSDADTMKVMQELMDKCTKFSKEVFDLKKTTYSQNDEIKGLNRRVRYLQRRQRSRTHKLKELHKIGSAARLASSCNTASLGEDASKQGMNESKVSDEDQQLADVESGVNATPKQLIDEGNVNRVL